MKRILASVAIFTCLGHSFAQNEDDALRYSMTYFGGSARNCATAGAFGAVGGDFSSITANPAGLARFKKHNFSFTAAVEDPTAVTSFYGVDTRQSGFVQKVSNISYVKAYNLDPKEFNNWYGVQMGLGYNRIVSFEERIRYTGTVDSSILHSFIKQANGVTTDNIYSAFPFDAGLAYDTYALDPGPNNTYVTDFTSGYAIHDREITRKGAIGEYNFMMSANYGNKLFLGGSLNFNRVKYSEVYNHRETYTDTSLWIRDIRYLSELTVKGWGVNARIGAIYMPMEWLRIGLSVQTPTSFGLFDRWSSNFFTNTDNGLKYVDESNVPTGSFNYKVRTPFRSNLSLGLVSKKLGSVGADVEFVDYSNAVLSSKKFSEAPYLFTLENDQIVNIYRPAVNFKIGGELRLKSQYYVRAGFAHYSSPYKEGKGNSLHPVQFVTGGLGYNFGKFYLDFASVFKLATVDYYAYDPTLNGSHAVVNIKNGQYLLTLGCRFE